MSLATALATDATFVTLDNKLKRLAEQARPSSSAGDD
jgi:hypothetical protein